MSLKEYNYILIIILSLAAAITTIAIFQGSKISDDAWFLPVLFAQIWVLVNNLRYKEY